MENDCRCNEKSIDKIYEMKYNCLSKYGDVYV